MQGKIKYFLPLLLFLPFFVVITFFHYQKIGAFGCGDDCFNIVSGYLINKGGNLYSGFFFDHAPLMAYMSALIQRTLHPASIYQLILYHRLSLYLFSLIFGIILTLRFRWGALTFLLIFETIKFYFFGDRFLAESFIVYPLVYMLGANLEKLRDSKLNIFDYLVAGLFTWFVIFNREPYAPVALFLLIGLLWKSERRQFLASISTFLMPTLITLLSLPFRDFYLNVVVYNEGRGITEIVGKGSLTKNLFATFLYPIYAFFFGDRSLLRAILIILSFPFLYCLFNLATSKQFKTLLFIIFALALSNIRFETPGFMYFQAYHMTVWYALFIFSLAYLIQFIGRNEKIFSYLVIGLALLISVLSAETFIRVNKSNVSEFSTNYSTEYTYGTAMKYLLNPGTTIFVDGRDELINFVAGGTSSYRYLWYTSFMPLIPMYSQERVAMFKNNPPDLYYDACMYIKIQNTNYIRILLNKKPSCLLLKKGDKVSDNQINAIKSLGFSLN